MIGAIWVSFQGDPRAISSFQIGPGEATFCAGCAAHATYVSLVRKFNKDELILHSTMYTLVASTLWIGAVGADDMLVVALARDQ